MRRKTLLSWSSGKDSAWALYVLRQDPTVEVGEVVQRNGFAYADITLAPHTIDGITP
jgi:hypothetical protein